MSLKRSHPSMPTSPQTVGSVASPELLHSSFSADNCDVVEFRLDSLLPHLTQVKDALIKLKASTFNTLITARCTSEGGQAELTNEQRSQLLMGLCPLATFVDIELAHFEAMRSTVDFIQQANSLAVASFHDFKKTPSADVLRDKIKLAIDLGADIVKFAMQHNSIDDIFSCAKLLQEGHPIAISMMGMGALAPTSRLLYAQLGSVLNYGFLGNTSTAPGQWPASLLHKAISQTNPF